MLKRYIPPWDDGLAWIVAALVLLAAVFLAGAPILAAVLLSVIAYAGLALARAGRSERQDQPGRYLGVSDAEAFRVSRTKVARLQELRRELIDPDVRDWIGSFGKQAEAILAVIEEDNKLRASPLFLQGIVVPSDDLLREYARLEGRNVQAAKPVLERIKRENLPLIATAAEDFYQQLHQTDVIEMDTLSERLEFNLSDRLPAIGRGER